MHRALGQLIVHENSTKNNTHVSRVCHILQSSLPSWSSFFSTTSLRGGEGKISVWDMRSPSSLSYLLVGDMICFVSVLQLFLLTADYCSNTHRSANKIVTDGLMSHSCTQFPGQEAAPCQYYGALSQTPTPRVTTIPVPKEETCLFKLILYGGWTGALQCMAALHVCLIH